MAHMIPRRRVGSLWGGRSGRQRPKPAVSSRLTFGVYRVDFRYQQGTSREGKTLTSTLQTTIVQLINATIDQASSIDTNGELDLTDGQRDEMNEAAASAFEAKADTILAPYGCTMLGNGDIIRIDIDDATVLEWVEEDVREAIANIEVYEVADQYAV